MTVTVDEAELEAFIGTVLDAYKDGRAGRATVVQLLTRAVMACATGNEPEYRAYIRVSKDTLAGR